MSTRTKLPIFVFDFGGVLIKWKDNNPIYDYIADRYGVSRAKLRKEFDRTLPRLESGDVSMRAFLTYALSGFGKGVRKGDSPDKLWELPFAQLVKPRVGAVKFVQSLRKKGHRVYLFSNTSLPHARYLRKAGWDEQFDGILTSCELGSCKPAPVAFRRALEKIDAEPSEVAFIDDKEVNVQGAKESGIRWAFRFTTLAQLKKDIASVTTTPSNG
ncbi:MAG: HAD family phosphatase [Thaumarchaeota archaeon]|nr:HAD family phosphatase [Nitrososphaerota archaeon]